MTSQGACLSAGCGNRQVPLRTHTEDVAMASGICESCSRMLKEFAAGLRRAFRDFERKLREVFRELSHCPCFRVTPEKDYLRRATGELSLSLLHGRYALL